MKTVEGVVVSVHVGAAQEFAKAPCDSIEVDFDGIVGDRHRSYKRGTWAGDKQPEGTVRRNERQWSAVSVEELAEITEAMDLSRPLSAAQLGANLCLSGVPQLSRLPKGTLLKFLSGAELIVEEFNPPCHGMGEELAKTMQTRSGKPLESTAFSKAAKVTRGIVGVVEVPGEIKAGDKMTVEIYQTPSWLVRDTG